jgi:hypothetical protein
VPEPSERDRSGLTASNVESIGVCSGCQAPRLQRKDSRMFATFPLSDKIAAKRVKPEIRIRVLGPQSKIYG